MNREQQQKFKGLADKLGLKEYELQTVFDSMQKYEGMDFEESFEKIKGGSEIITLAEASKLQTQSEKIPIGFPVLDEPMGGGMAVGNTMVIAAPSGEGKTQFMVSLSYYFAKRNIPSLWFSYEENVSDLWDRFKLTGIDDNVPTFCPIEISDNKLNFVERKIKQFKKDNKFFVVFIDQLSFLAPKVSDKPDVDHIQGNYAMYLGLISTQIKELAMEHKIIIIFAHQLGRTGDVAYSDMIKHAPDKVVYLKREPAPTDSNEEFTNKTFVIFKKNRPYGTRPRLAMTVEKGLFVPLQSATEYAEKEMGWKRIEDTLNI
jgi:predicted ATP-dependent serine protease